MHRQSNVYDHLSMAPDLAALPLVDFGRLKDPGTRHDELIKLRQALFEIGFLYLVNTGIAVSIACEAPNRDGTVC
jgi:isopenicillin N synthase-like dioxygenase